MRCTYWVIFFGLNVLKNFSDAIFNMSPVELFNERIQTIGPARFDELRISGGGSILPGTHDNNTNRGWFRKQTSRDERKFISDYVGKTVHEGNVSIELSRLAYASVARTAILPIQDILGLDESARMNIPATKKNNWLWRLQSKNLKKSLEERLSNRMCLYNR